MTTRQDIDEAIARHNLKAAETGGRSYAPFVIPCDSLPIREAREIEFLRRRLLAVKSGE